MDTSLKNFSCLNFRLFDSPGLIPLPKKVLSYTKKITGGNFWKHYITLGAVKQDGYALASKVLNSIGKK